MAVADSAAEIVVTAIEAVAAAEIAQISTQESKYTNTSQWKNFLLIVIIVR